MHTTNYYNTLIVMADDCPVSESQVPPLKGEERTIANYHFDFIHDHPYRYTSDEVIFNTFAQRNQLTSNLDDERALFFSKGQACLRASPLGKRYGWAIHHDAAGKVCLLAVGTDEYERLLNDPAVKKVKAMKSKR